MRTPLFLGIASLALALILTPLLRNLVVVLGWFDLPDHGRKIHRRPIPRVGGIPILLACAIPFALLTVGEVLRPGPLAAILPTAWRLAPSVGIVFAAGLIDDLIGLRPWQKLASQVAAASLACCAGFGIGAMGGHTLTPWLSVPLTILWLTACANAFNLIDGMDGLAAGASLLAFLAILAAALMLGHAGLAFVSSTLAGALLAFLVFNSSPASIFLGDCGSLSIGFLLGCCAIVWANDSVTLAGAFAPVMALSVPLLDMLLSVVRRVLRRRHVFHADRDHIHHRLLNRGLSARRVVLVLYAACGLAAALSLLDSFAGAPWNAAAIVLFCLAVWEGVRRVGYVELGIAVRLVIPARLLRASEAQNRLRALEDSLSRAAALDQCWEALCCACRDLGFARADMRLNGVARDASLQGPDRFALAWSLRVPLSTADYVNLGAALGSTVEPSIVAPLAALLHRCLEPRLTLASGQRATVPKDHPALDAPRVPAVSVPLC